MVELSAKFVCMKVDPGENGELAKTLGVSRLPNVRVVTSKGETVATWPGGVGAEELAKAMEKALAKP